MIVHYQAIVPSVLGIQLFLVLFKGESINAPPMVQSVLGPLEAWEVGQILGGN